MKKYSALLFLPLLMLTACSSSEDASTQAPVEAPVKSTEAPPETIKISKDNVFSGQVEALNAAKAVGAATQKSIDANQKKLEQARDY